MPKPATLRRRAQRRRASTRRASGPASVNSLAAIGEALKAVYLPVMQGYFAKSSPLLKHLGDNKGEFAGHYYMELPHSMR